VQVFHDLLGIGEFLPRHAKRYADVGGAITSAVEQYAADVRGGSFPEEGQTTHVDRDVVTRAELLLSAEYGLLDDEDAR
jgi:3-methyl-2-oxobutanoate hydroxymethyltransferase